ncbi:MAG: Gldg family protein [Myxococcota bacterium]
MNRKNLILVLLVAGWITIPAFFVTSALAYFFGGITWVVYASAPYFAAFVAVGLVSAQFLGTGFSLVTFTALLTLFASERGIGEGNMRLAMSSLAVLVLLGSGAIRLTNQHRRKHAANAGVHTAGLVSLGLIVVGLAMYALTFDSVAGAVVSGDEAMYRWTGAIGSIWPIFALTGFLPIVMLDIVSLNHPLRLPRGAARSAFSNGASAALAIALVFPVNYIAQRHEVSWDVAYFRTTRAGESTLAIVKHLSEPVEATLFFSNGSDVGREVEPYFATLAEQSGGMIRVTRVDQAMAPELAEELKIRDNGYIALKMGDSVEKFKIGTELKKAKRELKKLDETVQKNLLKVTKGQRTAYFVVGHGEANFRERDDQLRKLNLFKKVLESQNFKTNNLGVAEGLANEVPEDADLLIISGPMKPFVPEEIATITAWLDKGGALLVMADPGGDPMAGLMEHLGLTVGEAPLAHSKNHLKQSNGIGDRVLLATNRYGSHTAVSTLAKNGTTLAMVVPTVVSVEKAETAPGKVSTLIRTFPDTWPDTTPNRQHDTDEMGKVWDIAVAVSGPEKADGTGDSYRAIVIGDVNWASDPVIQSFQANQIFTYDSIRWLVGDDEIQGEINNEEDVKIQHTRDDDWAWFYLTVLGIPVLVLGSGILFVLARRMR